MEYIRKYPHDSGQFVGSAVIAGASYGPLTTLSRLETFAGDNIDYTVGGIPDPAGAAEFSNNNRRPISVKIQRGGERCSVTALAADGPRRLNIALRAALAFHQAGVRAVVDGDRQVGVSCSSQRIARG